MIDLLLRYVINITLDGCVPKGRTDLESAN